MACPGIMKHEFICGIPSNAAAMSEHALAELVSSRQLSGMHILGAASESYLLPRLSTIDGAGGRNLPETADAATWRKLLTEHGRDNALRMSIGLHANAPIRMWSGITTMYDYYDLAPEEDE